MNIISKVVNKYSYDIGMLSSKVMTMSLALTGTSTYVDYLQVPTHHQLIIFLFIKSWGHIDIFP